MSSYIRYYDNVTAIPKTELNNDIDCGHLIDLIEKRPDCIVK